MNNLITQTFRIEVMLRNEVLDPQGETIKQTIKSNTLSNVLNVRQGKVFEVKISEKSIAVAREKIKIVCEELLVNPVIETYKIYEV